MRERKTENDNLTMAREREKQREGMEGSRVRLRRRARPSKQGAAVTIRSTAGMGIKSFTPAQSEEVGERRKAPG